MNSRICWPMTKATWPSGRRLVTRSKRRTTSLPWLPKWITWQRRPRYVSARHWLAKFISIRSVVVADWLGFFMCPRCTRCWLAMINRRPKCTRCWLARLDRRTSCTRRWLARHDRRSMCTRTWLARIDRRPRCTRSWLVRIDRRHRCASLIG